MQSLSACIASATGKRASAKSALEMLAGTARMLALLALVLGGAVACGEDDDGANNGEDTVNPPVIIPVECESALDCEFSKGKPSGECEAWYCRSKKCSLEPEQENTPCGGQTAAICAQKACDGAGQCVERAAFDMTSCGPGDSCQGDFCIAGDCIKDFQLVICNDGEPCTSDACVNGACVFTTNSLPCDDGNACTDNDTCDAGVCRGEPAAICPCTTDSQCPDDGNKCNGVERCIDGQCTSDPATAVTCVTAADSCQVGICNPASGACNNVTLPSGTPCNDGDECTDADVCANGACVGEPVENCPTAE